MKIKMGAYRKHVEARVSGKGKIESRERAGKLYVNQGTGEFRHRQVPLIACICLHGNSVEKNFGGQRRIGRKQ